ncbi:MAG: PTS system mannose/fructose/sorbose family transporter subunit IID [Gemmatimonadota bacterium]
MSAEAVRGTAVAGGRVRGALTRGALVSSFLRSFLVQGSWNYHTMLGCGFAFSLLPGLRRLFGRDDLAGPLERHVELFNAHPYLVGVALGAVLKLESDEADAETVRRFKLAVRGPLGSLGDALVWAAWLPGVSVAALTMYWLGAPGWLSLVAFLVVYNVGHIGLRLWGFRVGLAAGRDVGARLARADLSGWTRRVETGVTVLLGALVGALLAGDRGLAEAGALWVALAFLAFLAGLLGGHRGWRPTAATVVATIGVLTAAGMVR